MNQTEERNMKNKIMRGRIIRNTAVTVLCVVLGVVIAFEYKTIKSAANVETENHTLVDYQSTIIELSKNVEALKQEKAELEQKVRSLETGTNEERIRQLETLIAELRRQACLTEVTGEGIVITLNYASKDDIALSGTMLMLLINELKASDALAIAINGERLHSMSEIRPVNDYLVVNGNAFYTPITISVAGNARNLMNAISVSGVQAQFENFFDVKGGQFLMNYSKEVTVPALSEDYLKSITGSLKTTEE